MTGDDLAGDDAAGDDLAELAELVDDAAAGFARLSPAARRFMAGAMDDDEAVRLGFRRPVE